MDERIPVFRIQIKRYEKPFSSDLETSLEYICKSFGFYEPIDKDKTAYALFKEIIVCSQNDRYLSSTDLSKRVHMSRGSVINHLNRLQSSGLIIRQGKFYVPRAKSIYHLIQEIEEDIERVFKKMQQTAKRLDRELGIEFED